MPFAASVYGGHWGRLVVGAAAGGAAAALAGSGAMPAVAAACASAIALAFVGKRDGVSGRAGGMRTTGALNKAVFDSVADGIVGLDGSGRITFVNPAAESLSGWKESEIIGLAVDEVFANSLRAELGVEAAHYRFEISLPRRAGDPIPVEMHLSPIIEKGRITGQIAVFHDIRERRSAEENRKLAAAVLEWSAQAIIVADAKGCIVTVNPAFSRLSGYAPEEIIGRPVSVLRSDRHDASFHANIHAALDKDGAWKGEVWNQRKDGAPYAVWLSITRIAAETQATGFLVAFYFDITDRKKHEERIIAAANHDALTGMPNRRMFEERLSKAIDLAGKTGQMVAVLLIDLDGFKAVNDTYGHEAGDALLKALAGRMTSAVRSTDMAARLGGDEFVVLLPDLESRAAAARVAESLIERLSQKVPYAGNDLLVSASIGIAVLGPGGRADDLLKAADQAMYAVKRGGKNGYLFFAPELESAESAAVGNAMHPAHAPDHGELHVLFQPIIDLTDLSVWGIDACSIRRRFEGSFETVDPMLAVRDGDGKAVTAGDWMRREAVRALAQWRLSWNRHFLLTLSMSQAELEQADVVERLLALVDEYSVPAGCVAVVVQEEIFRSEGFECADALAKLGGAGMRLIVDGFSGAASRMVRIDAFKPLCLRQSVARIKGEGKTVEEALQRLQGLAKSCRARLFLSDVETPEQVSMLLGLGASLAQGNVLGQAVPADEIGSFASAFEQTREWKQ